MFGHLLFFRDRGFILPLKFVAFVDSKSINPGNRLIADEAEIGFPSDQVIGVLDNKCSLLWRIVVLAFQEIVAEK